MVVKTSKEGFLAKKNVSMKITSKLVTRQSQIRLFFFLFENTVTRPNTGQDPLQLFKTMRQLHRYDIFITCVWKQDKPNQTTSKLPYKDLIVFLVSLLGKEPGFFQLVLQGIHTFFIGQRPVLENLTGTGRRTIQLQYNIRRMAYKRYNQG